MIPRGDDGRGQLGLPEDDGQPPSPLAEITADLLTDSLVRRLDHGLDSRRRAARQRRSAGQADGNHSGRGQHGRRPPRQHLRASGVLGVPYDAARAGLCGVLEPRPADFRGRSSPRGRSSAAGELFDRRYQYSSAAPKTGVAQHSAQAAKVALPRRRYAFGMPGLEPLGSECASTSVNSAAVADVRGRENCPMAAM